VATHAASAWRPSFCLANMENLLLSCARMGGGGGSGLVPGAVLLSAFPLKVAVPYPRLHPPPPTAWHDLVGAPCLSTPCICTVVLRLWVRVLVCVGKEQTCVSVCGCVGVEPFCVHHMCGGAR
jgi:hypothetical protein